MNEGEDGGDEGAKRITKQVILSTDWAVDSEAARHLLEEATVGESA